MWSKDTLLSSHVIARAGHVGRQATAWCERRHPIHSSCACVGILVVALVVFVTAGPPATANSAQFSRSGSIQADEYRLKAAYLYNFLLYVTWPDEAFEDEDSPLVIGVLGNDPLGTALDEVARRKKAKGRDIHVRRFRSWDDFQPCHVLFLPRTAGTDAVREAIRRTEGKPLLLVGEAPGAAMLGATINFYLDFDRTIGFEINVDATAERRLRVDARLLKLARVIRSSR